MNVSISSVGSIATTQTSQRYLLAILTLISCRNSINEFEFTFYDALRRIMVIKLKAHDS